MGSSTLQSVLVQYFNRILLSGLDENRYWVLTSEAGLHLNSKINLANDVAVYETAVLTPDKINTKYAEVPPKLVVEIDVKADLSDPTQQDYVNRKTQKLLDFGTQKVIWIFTTSQKVMLATQSENWQTMDWNKDVTLLDDLTFNIAAYLNKKGIVIEKEDS